MAVALYWVVLAVALAVGVVQRQLMSLLAVLVVKQENTLLVGLQMVEFLLAQKTVEMVLTVYWQPLVEGVLAVVLHSQLLETGATVEHLLVAEVVGVQCIPLEPQQAEMAGTVEMVF
jgi:hypothetical protein